MIEIRNSKLLTFCLVLFAVILFQPSAIAQRNNYERLAFRYNRPNVYITTFGLPASAQNEVQLTIPFRINYQLLSFKKLNEPGSSAFYATPALRIEIYKSPRKNLRFNEQVSIVDLESVARASWSDTVYAANYESTKFSNFATGFMQVALPPGHYTYILQFSQNGSDRKTSATRNIHVDSYTDGQSGSIILAGEVSENSGEKRLNLFNLGGDVFYGQNFYAFIHLPDFSSEKNYRVKVHRVGTSREDTTRIETVFEEMVSKEQVITGIAPELSAKNGQLYVQLRQNENAYAYALVQIPGSTFPDATYKIEVVEDESGETIARKVYQTLWLDKPVSLYSVDVAIEMLRFIVDEATIEQIGSGSEAEEREKLNAFWEKRDPTPNTEFNELKAEYYQRIDYAYEHFSSTGTPGFETDRGRIYILYGPPEDIERVYPSEGATREIWSYENRRFVFKATSGFGNFKLIER